MKGNRTLNQPPAKSLSTLKEVIAQGRKAGIWKNSVSPRTASTQQGAFKSCQVRHDETYLLAHARHMSEEAYNDLRAGSDTSRVEKPTTPFPEVYSYDLGPLEPTDRQMYRPL